MKKIMQHLIFFGLILIVLNVSVATAQVGQPSVQTAPRGVPPSQSRPDNPGEKNESPLTSFEEEIRAKRAIKMAEKDHQENVDRAKELADIAKDLQTCLKDKSKIDRDSVKKIERLEKLTKKIRNEAGGEDEEVDIVDRPADITGAVNQIAKSAEALSKTVQDTPRQVVSASVIGNANVLLELIKLLRAFDTRP